MCLGRPAVSDNFATLFSNVYKRPNMCFHFTGKGKYFISRFFSPKRTYAFIILNSFRMNSFSSVLSLSETRISALVKIFLLFFQVVFFFHFFSVKDRLK